MREHKSSQGARLGDAAQDGLEAGPAVGVGGREVGACFG